MPQMIKFVLSKCVRNNSKINLLTLGNTYGGKTTAIYNYLKNRFVEDLAATGQDSTKDVYHATKNVF